MNGQSDTKLRIALIAGEASGDHLGAALIDALVRQAPARELELFGVGGPEMEARGLASCFPMSDIAVMGPIAILRQFPKLLGHLRQAVDFVIERKPDILVIIDCPEFSHRLARRVRRRLADLPIIDYVAPSVWAWRPGRARAMKAYVDQVMALLPFEPEAYARLGGPPCHYVGHPAAEASKPDAERIAALRAELGRMDSPVLAVMPGSRRNELKRLCNPFGDALAMLAASEGDLPVIIPTLPHLRSDLEDAIRDWPLPALIVTDPQDRRAAMALADAAIVASGTATLELALERTPMVVAYRTESLIAWAKPFVVAVHSIVLANLVHGGTPIPELYQGECTGQRLADCVGPLLRESDERTAQLRALEVIASKVTSDGVPPSDRAARIVLEAVGGASDRNAGAASV